MKKQYLLQTLLSCVLTIVLTASQHALAQARPIATTNVGQQAALDITATNGTILNMNSYRGKVVMVFHWSTNCSICLDKMMELRDNTAGWINRPFALIAINHDAKKQDYQDYVRVLGSLKTAPAQMQFVYYKDVVQDSLFKSNLGLPQTYVVDAQGVLRYAYNGRIPPQAWDQVAELLP